MTDFFLFLIFFVFVLCERVIELSMAKRNEKWMKGQGAIEFGSGHYRFIVFVHSMFFVCFSLEKLLLNKGLSPIWPVVLLLFLFSQMMRIWVISSLGRFWNTKIIVLKDTLVVKRGPYRYIKHPNYLVVAMEFILIPFMFDAYFTAGIFTFLNMMIMMVRIPAEENALKDLTEYDEAFINCGRFVPILLNKNDR